jgi:hypothetical protein
MLRKVCSAAVDPSQRTEIRVLRLGCADQLMCDGRYETYVRNLIPSTVKQMEKKEKRITCKSPSLSLTTLE